MMRKSRWLGVVLWVCACGGESAAPPIAPAATAPVAPTKPSVAAPAIANPCATPGPRTIEIEAGVITQTPWDLELTYAIDEDKKTGSGFMFLLRSGDARWETRRDNTNWTKLLTWRGFCWRGADRPDKRATRVKIDVAPVCKDGVLQELGGCGDALAGT